MSQNIYLCGFMGCGKSTAGPLLAKALGYAYSDLDTCIEQAAGLSIPEVFRLHGESHFRNLEHQQLCLAAQTQRVVVATGGGALTFSRNLPLVQHSGVVIFLNPGFPVCYNRISGDPDRPLASGGKEGLATLYQKREPLYRVACHIEIVGELSPTETVEQILSQLAQPAQPPKGSD